LPGPEIVGDVLIGLRFLRGFPGFLRHPIDPPRAREILERRFRERAAGFLTVVREGAYRRPGSPYHRLLAAAGCEYGDLERLVRQDGVDGALERLLRDGVYVTLDEFKGRRPIVRGSTTFTTDPTQFRNPMSGAHVAFPSGGSRGKATPILFDFAFIRDLSVNTCVILSELGGLGWTRACWDVPGSGVMIRVLDSPAWACGSTAGSRTSTRGFRASRGATAGASGPCAGAAGWRAVRSRPPSTCRPTTRCPSRDG
jgi:hypothetical protein